MTIDARKTCPVCESSFMFHIMDVPTRRTKKQIALYACMDCKSLSNPSGYVEDDATLARDLQWNISVEDRNIHAARRLIEYWAEAGFTPASSVEVGCGTGVLVSEMSKAGIRASGFDINPHAINYGVQNFACDLHHGYWSAESIQGKRDVVICISVLEHIEFPRVVLSEISKYCRTHQSKAFISVPMVNKEQWRFLLDVDPTAPGTPFFDNDVHITHFSTTGLAECLKQLGAKDLQFIGKGLWQGFLAGF